MEVILLEPVKKLGNIGQKVRVRDGFARNFLIPTKKAIRATAANLKLFEARKAEIEKENAKKTAEAEKVAKKAEAAIVTIIRQAGEDGRLYGSVTAKDIADALNAAGHKIDRQQVVLNTPIKYIGVYTTELHLHGEVAVNVHPNVARSDDEAKESKARFERGEVVMEGLTADKKAGVAAAAIAAAAIVAAEAPAEAAAAPEAAEGEAKPKKKAKKAKAEDAA